ncbi:MAG: SufD family Fe-S cluster assembly protein, partial [Candidatus Nanohaloarchaea archaeon]
MSGEEREKRMPESVRTPGRTWTEFPEFERGSGSGTLEVETPDGVTVERGSRAVKLVEKERNGLVGEHLGALADEDTVTVRIPETVSEPVNIRTRLEEGFYPHHVVVVVGEGASARVVEENMGGGELDSAVVEAVVGDGAELEYTRVNSLGDSAGHSLGRVEAGENADVDWTTVSTGSDVYKSTVETKLDGSYSSLDHALAFLSSGQQHMDHTVKVVHAADSTSCDIEARGVAMESSRAVYKGVQEVKEEAERTESFQNEETVLIGDDAEADTTPQLRIDNSDVEATHAAATGHLDEEDLFYM